jgi:pyruvate-formate lyase-activating enzyme
MRDGVGRRPGPQLHDGCTGEEVLTWLQGGGTGHGLVVKHQAVVRSEVFDAHGGSPAEIEEIAIPHLRAAQSAVVSFGQGCEGEPLLQAKTIEQSIINIRKHTARGTINLNSNASHPEAVARLAASGLDSLRVSLNSVREPLYNAYYRPNGYRFADVKDSIKTMKKAGGFVSLNYFLQPGITDSLNEYEALVEFLGELRPDMIQLRNLNIDPDWYLANLPQETAMAARAPLGIAAWLKKLRQRFPALSFGYFNPCLDPNSVA